MSKVLFHGSIQGFRGRIGNLIFRQMPDGTTVVTQAPPKKSRRQKERDKRKRSAGQQAHNSRFQQASMYAELAAAAPMKTAYNFAIAGWFNPPVIHRIERRDGRILVEANDNVRVTKVQVTVLDDEGQVLEKGEAVRGAGDWWEFASQSEGKRIMAEAWDFPGHVTQLIV